ncbi:MAG: hypothetical protein SGBAC_003165 [Bacillariaceae sp.]
MPPCWKDYYRYNPCVPVDFPSINRALASVTTHKHLHNRSIRVLLRPGRYILKETITVEANHEVNVTIETMDLPESFNHFIECPKDEKPNKLKKSLLKLLSCRTVDADDEDEPPPEFPEPSSELGLVLGKERAVLTLRCKKHNQPVVKVRRGSCILRNLELRHITYGIDIWNGNAAIQIQPPMSPDEQPIPVAPMPTAVLDHVDITSESGRGVVNIDGGNLTLRNCYIHDCAATGVYVGAAASKLTLQNTDVVRNGNGNRQHRRGIARGHSGIYLEQGLAEITNSSISQNSLTGISAVSPVNAILHLSESELVSNGSTQLEMPDIGTQAQRNSCTRDVHLADVGFPRLRSELVGLPYDPNAVSNIVVEYQALLDRMAASDLPETAQYRVDVEKIARYRIKIAMENPEDPDLVEDLCQCGQVEELVEQARDEMEVLDMYLKERLWEHINDSDVDIDYNPDPSQDHEGMEGEEEEAS